MTTTKMVAVQTTTPTGAGSTTVTATATTATPTATPESSSAEPTTQQQVTQTQPSNPQSITPPVATPSTAVASTRPTVSTEMTTAAKVSQPQTSPVTTTDASMSTVITSPHPTTTSQNLQNQSPSSTSTTVNLSQSTTVPGMEVTTSKATTVSPTTSDVEETTKKGSPCQGDKMVVYKRGQRKDKGNPVFFKVCEELMNTMQADSCTLDIDPANGTVNCASVQVNPALLDELLEKHKQVPAEEEPPKNTSLIVILCSCGALLVMTAAFIAYITCHRKNYRKNQQHLTEELQTVENGYHDNPTLEVMEVQPEMQEKKAAPNGEFNDSWIVPFDTLAKDEGPEEEDTHL
ncbi:hypothetical protein GJAV_G00270510 [Gymnothorax javanicus]|nr:hypothetical protein GJAV_G00270510 [Gymnothorax javanicus]